MSVQPEVAAWFQAVDTDRSGHISAPELQQALTNGNWSTFSERTCRLMIAMFDQDQNGTIDMYEFQMLLNYLNQWRAIFASHDRDQSGFLDTNEIMSVLTQIGYRISLNVINAAVRSNPRVTLDEFIVLCVRLHKMTEVFRTKDSQQNGNANLSYEEFLSAALVGLP